MRISVWRSDVFSSDLAVPDPIRDMVRSFLDWLKSPVILANNLFQGDLQAAEITVSRFVANAPFFGFIDNATGLGLEHRNEDFGQTLATYGAGDGPRSEEHTSELQSLMRISYAVFCLKKKKNTT